MQHPYDQLSLTNGASFIFTPCPGTKEADLVSSVKQLSDAGAKAIVTLMYDDEIAANQAENLPQACKDTNIDWFQLPISDDSAPNQDFEDAFSASYQAILAIIKNQSSVAVHCKGGSGRTGLVIAVLLVQLGYEKSEVVEMVQAIRPKALVNPTQKAFFEAFQAIA